MRLLFAALGSFGAWEIWRAGSHVAGLVVYFSNDFDAAEGVITLFHGLALLALAAIWLMALNAGRQRAGVATPLFAPRKSAQAAAQTQK